MMVLGAGRTGPWPADDDVEGVMDEFQRSWLTAHLGPEVDVADLKRRFLRLGSVHAVALKVLGERRAKLLADPLKVSVDGVVTMDPQENLRGIERQIESMQQAPAPDGLRARVKTQGPRC